MKYLTKKEMAKVDRLAVEKYNISVLQMMENAGRNVANFIFKLKPKRVIVFYGKGNNGGDGLCSARHLLIKGIDVKIIPASKNLNSNTQSQLNTLKQMRIKPSENYKPKKGDIILDCLLGYNVKGNPRQEYAEIINQINLARERKIKIVSFDLPSGLNPNTGECFNPCVKANYILTLALPKKGLKKIKNVYLVNIGIPNELYKKYFKYNLNSFKKGDIIKIS